MEPTKTFEREILAAHPESGGIPGAGKSWEVAKIARWDLAMKLVGERHEKAELVWLVNWLLVDRDRLAAGKARLEYMKQIYPHSLGVCVMAIETLEGKKP